MPQKPLFSIITITLNNAKGLAKTKESILTQTCTDYEWIVQDGASTDNSLDLLQNSGAIIQSEKDKGIYNAMNRAIPRAKGDYILFLNAGDCLATSETLQIIKNMPKQNPALIYGDAIEDNKIKKSRTHAGIKYGMFTHHQAMLYNRKALSGMRYDETYQIAADYDLTARFLEKHPETLYIPVPLCIFETGGISQQNAAQGRKEQFQTRKSLKLCPAWQNHAITALQSINLTLRRFLPPLYWLLKRH